MYRSSGRKEPLRVNWRLLMVNLKEYALLEVRASFLEKASRSRLTVIADLVLR